MTKPHIGGFLLLPVLIYGIVRFLAVKTLEISMNEFEQKELNHLEREKRLRREFESKYAKQLDENQKLAKRLGETRAELEELKRSIQPLKDNINALTSERSKFIRKIKRLDNKQ